RGATDPPPHYVAERYLGRSYSLAADLRGWDEIAPVRDGSAIAGGVVDLLALATTELDGIGCGFFSFRSTRSPISDQAHIELTRIARHLAAAHRLRRRVETDAPSSIEPDAVLDPEGRVHHARGAATAFAARAALSRATQEMSGA